MSQAALGRLTTQRALEVPLGGADGPSDALPTREVPALGEAAFELPPLAAGAALAGRSEPSQGGSGACCLLWRLEGAAPQTLVLQEAGVTDERREAAAALAFEAPLLPAVAITDVHGAQGTRLSALTADGALHTFVHSGTPGAASLARQLAAAGAVTSVPLAPLFARAGPPTALLEVGSHLCIGTADGNVVCLPAGPGPDDVAAAFQLSPASGLSKASVGMGWAVLDACAGGGAACTWMWRLCWGWWKRGWQVRQAGTCSTLLVHDCTMPAAAAQQQPSPALCLQMLGGLFGQQRGQAVCQLAELRHLVSCCCAWLCVLCCVCGCVAVCCGWTQLHCKQIGLELLLSPCVHAHAFRGQALSAAAPRCRCV